MQWGKLTATRQEVMSKESCRQLHCMQENCFFVTMSKKEQTAKRSTPLKSNLDKKLSDSSTHHIHRPNLFTRRSRSQLVLVGLLHPPPPSLPNKNIALLSRVLRASVFIHSSPGSVGLAFRAAVSSTSAACVLVRVSSALLGTGSALLRADSRVLWIS